MLAVSDTGTGMDEETISHLFEPFFTTKEKGKGMGLGLSTVYGIVKQSGGFIWAYSEPRQGTTFKIYLPGLESKGGAMKREIHALDGLGGSETILLVEDNRSVLNLAKRVLKQYGYNVLEAQDGEQALKVSEEHEGPIHLLLTDVVMPRMPGREVAGYLQPLRPEMKVIYMTGYTNGSIVYQGILDPGCVLIEKPFTPVGLAAKVREMLDGRIED